MGDLYRKRQTESVEANQLSKENALAVALWCGAQQVEETDPMSGRDYVGLNVPTLQGVRRASEGDYVVKLATGGFTTFRENEFEALYEKVD